MANYIKKLQSENEQLKKNMEYAIELLIDMQRYYNSEKFHGVENNYAHVTTDVYPKISSLKMFLAGSLNSL